MAFKVGLGLVGAGYGTGWFGSVGETAASRVHIAVDRILATVDRSSDPRVIPITAEASPVTVANYYTYGTPDDSGLGKQGRALYGVYNPTPANWQQLTTAQANQTVEGAAKTWSVTNPYGAVVFGNDFYLIDNDNVDTLPPGSTDPTLQYSASIYKYDLSGATPFEELGEFYRFVPGSSGGNTWKGAGTGLDLYTEGSNNYLIATFNRYTNVNWTYTYGPSDLVKINLSTSAATTVAVNGNTNGVVVEGEYAYVTSVGGAQVANGSDLSQLQVVDITSATPTIVATLTTAESDALLTTGIGYTQGDYTDVAFVNGKAYVLLAQYDTSYSQYKYAIIQTTEDSLRGGAFDPDDDKFVIATVNPASPCFALLPGGDNSLYFVDGVHVNEINTSGDIDATGAINPIVAASDFSNSGTAGYVLNTAGIVIEKTALVRPRGVARATVTKLAKRLARPEELEKRK
ncbi:hypothetical protein [Sporomusa termitida]|uniref:Uncharacterized protein n=1 Tax=Sporomusa termitida TaxID=2377 RepID=A0A517DWT8_9FIRM|nr:hypothetical protein [Sporomusa termitida]QDR81793.1 hypothetical protein SPTER_32060 [Sporomusa termitida]